jgi:hypothetical protein
MPIAEGPTGTFTDYPFWAMQPQFLILRGSQQTLLARLFIRPSPKPCAVTQARGPLGMEGTLWYWCRVFHHLVEMFFSIMAASNNRYR